jgi:hypothetical protein
LAKFAGNGSLTFYRVYEQPNQYTEVGPVCQSSDGTKYFTAIPVPLITDGGGGSTKGLGLIVFDANGNLLAQRGWPSLNGTDETMVDMIQTANGGFAVLSAKSDYSGFTVRKFNSAGSATTLERTVSRTPNAPFNIRPLSLAETADGGLLIGISTGTDAGLIKIQTNGSLAFVTALGGPDNEGGPYSNGPSGTYAIATADGGYALTCTTTSYYTGLVGKPDWWAVKTDANRRIRNFTGTQADQPLDYVTISGNQQVPHTFSYYMIASYTASANSSIEPVFDLIDLDSYPLPDLPTITFQASSPRIVGSNTAEAVVNQHFAYHTVTAFFANLTNVTFTAKGLPQGFVIDSHTGVISGSPAKGTETTQPIAITLSASDGTDTASLVLQLSIGDGVPVFSVNASDQPVYPNPSATPVGGLADTVLSFVAKQPGSVAGRIMRVQATTTPNVAVSWTVLPNATNGRMTYDPTTDQYFLSSNDYPHTQADPVYFRTVASAQGYPDKVSNVVGPFNLTSNNARLGTTRLLFTGNGSIADLYFLGVESATPNGVTVRVQATTTPGTEASWSDLDNGSSGHMTQSVDPAKFILLVNNYPITQGVYFRAVGSASGFVDSISNVVGPLDVTTDTAPVVAVFPPEGLPGSGDGHDADHPVVINAGSSSFGAVAHSSRSIGKVRLLIDGAVVATYPGEADQNTLYPANFTATVGDHVLEAAATDDLGATARAGTGAIYLRVLPLTSALKAKRAAGDSTVAAASAGKVFTAVQSAGFWNSPSMWKDQNGNKGVPGPNDLAIVGKSDIGFAQGDDIKVQSISINGGGLNGAGVTQTLTVSGIMTITSGDIDGVNIIISEGAELELFNATDITFGVGGGGVIGSIYNHGNINLHGAAGVRGMNVFQNFGTVNWRSPLSIAPNASTDPNAGSRVLQTASLLNSGLISGDPASVVSDNGLGLIGSDSAGLIGHDSSSLVAAGGGNIVAAGGGNIISSNSGGLIGSDSAGIVAAGGGNVVAAGGGNFAQRTTQEATTASSGYSQSAGESNLSAFDIIGPVILNGGTLSGRGIIVGNLTNNGGYIAPGGLSSPGVLAITGNFTQGANGTLILEAAGGEPYQFDQVQVGGAGHLNGKLDIKTINGFVPLPNDPFNPLGFGSVVGAFSSVSSNAQIKMAANGLVATVNPSAPSPKSGQPLNIATRLAVQGGDNVLIAGFIVTGPSGSTKKVLIRGIGPSLAKFGVAGIISDPLLELHKPGGSTVTNDNWQQGDTSQIPNGFAPADPRESVIVATLSPGNYSAVLKGAHGETGIALAEVYDLAPTSAAQLGNIATRGFVDTGDNVMIGGFIVGGTEPAKVLVRAIGPSLTAFGVQGALPATTLELHDSNGAVISNEGWRNAQEADIQATTIPPTNDNEAAILATLVPGNYTAVVRGKNNTTGIGLVEAYNLP